MLAQEIADRRLLGGAWVEMWPKSLRPWLGARLGWKGEPPQPCCVMLILNVRNTLRVHGAGRRCREPDALVRTGEHCQHCAPRRRLREVRHRATHAGVVLRAIASDLTRHPPEAAQAALRIALVEHEDVAEGRIVLQQCG